MKNFLLVQLLLEPLILFSQLYKISTMDWPENAAILGTVLEYVSNVGNCWILSHPTHVLKQFPFLSCVNQNVQYLLIRLDVQQIIHGKYEIVSFRFLHP